MKIVMVFTFIAAVSYANEINLKEFKSGIREFAAEVYQNLAESNENFLLSPLSVEIVLALAQSGAKDETGEEIRTVLHLPKSIEKVETIFKRLIPKLKSHKSYSLINANKIYVQSKYSIKEKFLELAKKVYHCPIENIDFTNKKAAVEIINSWVQKKTNNKIHDIIDLSRLTDLTAAIFINTIYFKGAWQKPFKPLSTKKEVFYKTLEESQEVDVMHNQDEYGYYESETLDAKFLKLNFKNSKKAQMIFVLPNKKDGLRELESNISGVLITPAFEKQHVLVGLPKFKIETKINFEKILTDMGVEKAFGDKADFSEIAGEKGQLQISDILQKTFIDVREGGVEATAATSVQFSSRSFIQHVGERKNFIATHPFLFYLKIKNVVVFVGRVLSPS